ncbi:MAG: SIS domain-containing protein [Acidimicrobiaceae bacterium]|nr:SIS domain-containing protein [Acidimicrobiaceae bacterium]MYK74943.1 SIS domain-containing protein [Acidimicrobiaceae bacterium]
MTAAIDCGRDPVGAAMWLARAFTAGRRLCVSAPGAPDHAHHVAVEFVHPVVAGTRSLAAVAAPDGDAASPADARLVIGEARAASALAADLFIPPDQPDRAVVLSYHLLWELVQVALEHPGLVGSAAAAGGDSTGFLYPFLDAAEDDEASLRDALRASAEAKRDESARLAQQSLESNRSALEEAGTAIGRAAAAGGRVLTMGNGGSATDAARLARVLRSQGVAAESLAVDYAVATALANDLGAERIFSRQLDAFGQPGDVLVGCSTSGASRNLLAAFDQAATMGLATVGISGYGGGSFTGQASVHHNLVVQSMSVHRIQEAQAALMTSLCERAAGLQGAGEQTVERAR